MTATGSTVLLLESQEAVHYNYAMTIFDRLGGDAGVAALLEELYSRALKDPLLKPFLENVNIDQLKAQQFRFISQAIGGPHQYHNRSLVQAHAHLQIEQRHFDAFVGHLRGALQGIGADDDVSAAFMAQVEPLSSVIVNYPPES